MNDNVALLSPSSRSISLQPNFYYVLAKGLVTTPGRPRFQRSTQAVVLLQVTRASSGKAAQNQRGRQTYAVVYLAETQEMLTCSLCSAFIFFAHSPYWCHSSQSSKTGQAHCDGGREPRQPWNTPQRSLELRSLPPLTLESRSGTSPRWWWKSSRQTPKVDKLQAKANMSTRYATPLWSVLWAKALKTNRCRRNEAFSFERWLPSSSRQKDKEPTQKCRLSSKHPAVKVSLGALTYPRTSREQTDIRPGPHALGWLSWSRSASSASSSCAER